MNTSPKHRSAAPARIEVGGLPFDELTEDGVVALVRTAWAGNRGDSIIPVNVDVARAAGSSNALVELIGRGSLVIADGMPIVWAARLQGNPLPERIAGSSLMASLSAAAAADGKSVYLLGGAEGMAGMAAESLVARFPPLRVAGTQSPEFGFDKTAAGCRQVITPVASAAPDLVFVGLGFPKQELLIDQLRLELPNAWFLACGGGIAMAAGVVPRASRLVQRLGLEWAHRLILEPRRLARRYLRDDLPFAIALLTQAAARGIRKAASRNFLNNS